MIPMIVGGSVIGSIAMSTIKRELIWPRQLLDRIKVVGNIFASALTRKQAEQSLHKVLREVKRLKEQLEAENIYLRKYRASACKHYRQKRRAKACTL